MQNKNARQQVKDVSCKLQDSVNALNSAINSVEKPENRQKIESTLSAVNSALESANCTLSNYQEQ